MKTRITTSILVCLALSVCFGKTAFATSKPPRPTIKYIIGKVRIVRNGNTVHLRPGSPAVYNDIYMIQKNSLIAFALPGSTIEVKGPRTFVMKYNDIRRSLARENTLSRLFAKISKDTVPYYPRTLVTAVRGHFDQNGSDEDARKDLERAIAQYNAQDLKASWKTLTTIERSYYLKRHPRTIIAYYKANILFRNMRYSEALSLYQKIFRSRFSRFKHKEKAMAQAIICYELTAKTDSAKKLAREYGNKYGKDGAYWKVFKELGLVK